MWWLLPAVAAGSLLVALVLGRRLVSYALVLLAALELAVWVWLRRDGAFRAIIPTDAPFWLDRGVMAATAVVAVLVAVGAAVAMFRLAVAPSDQAARRWAADEGRVRPLTHRPPGSSVSGQTVERRVA